MENLPPTHGQQGSGKEVFSSATNDLSKSSNSKRQEAIWYPRNLSELDKCTHIVTKCQPELDCGHPGFQDNEYKSRRMEIVELAFDYRYGQEIPRVEYTDAEINTWAHVYRKVSQSAKAYACREYLDGIAMLEKECIYSEKTIPQLEVVSEFLKGRTGFHLRPVAGVLSSRDFLASLALRVFQCTQYIRHPSKPSHSSEPDCIHELLGHVPMLANPTFAQFSQTIGLISLGATDIDITRLATLYWFTVEFGLCKEGDKLCVYGAGILSSYDEMNNAMSDRSQKRPLDPENTALQAYTDESVQPVYFVAESLEHMRKQLTAYGNTIKKSHKVYYEPCSQSIIGMKDKDAKDNMTEDHERKNGRD